MVSSEVILPSEVLRPYVHHYWIMRTRDLRMSQVILPVGCLKWIFHRKKPLQVNGMFDVDTRASIVGLYDKAIHIDNTGDLEMITVFFQPYAAKWILGVPCQEFSNGNYDFECLESIEFNELKFRILESQSTDACIGMIESFILKRLVKTQNSPYEKPLIAAFNQLVKTPDVRIEALSSTACMSERQFRRVFLDHVGMKPKQIQRIQRFRMAVSAILRSKEVAFDDILYQLGYTDHSHFNREFHEMSGMSPSEYLRYLE